jgi:RNA polymerase sigma-70 factor (ECF subfamily)
MDATESQDERAERWRGWMAVAQTGDGETYGRLLTELLPFVRGLVRARLGDDAALDDVAQEVLMRIHTARHTYRAERPLLPWVRTITRNAVIDQARRRTRALNRSSSVEPESIAVDPPELPGSDRLSPVLERALETLPHAQREAVWLLKVEGLSVAEAAERIGVTAGALKLRAHRGYRGLRDLLGRELL